MKLENCGRCGLEPEVTHVKRGQTNVYGWTSDRDFSLARCPVHGGEKEEGPVWNAVQFAARTERINAAAVALMAASFSPDCGMWTAKDAIADATILIDAQDVAARVRWAEMQGG